MQLELITDYGLCQCGCGERTRVATKTDVRANQTRGLPIRYVPGHHKRKTPIRYIETDTGFSTACWLWQGAANRRGYGQMTVAGKKKEAHRAYYESANGPVPVGLELDHLCRVPACVNPEHLEPVTHAENARRGAKAKITPEIVTYIRASSKSDRALARELGVSHRTVGCARTGKSWGSVTSG